MPPPGIETSRSATSGRSVSTSAIASPAVPASPTTAKPRVLGDAADEAFAEDRVIVGQDHADAHGVSPSASGRRRRRVVPRPAALSISSVAADALGAIAQAGEALAAVGADADRGRRIEAGSPVLDGDGDLPRRDLDGDAGGCARGVAGGVGERLLDEAVGADPRRGVQARIVRAVVAQGDGALGVALVGLDGTPGHLAEAAGGRGRAATGRGRCCGSRRARC